MDTKKTLIIIAICLVLILFVWLIFRGLLKNYKGHNRLLLFLRYKIFRIKKGSKQKCEAYYSVKPKYISPCEQQYFAVLKDIVGVKYLVFPQVPLSQIVEKHSGGNYKSELFRVIDFCIFDIDYYPLLCIEINDASHLKKDRTNRDGKVSEILKSARLPLVTLWTYEEIDKRAIKKQIERYVKL